MAALSLATDLGLGQPLEHELGVCLAALELADRLGCSAEECSDVYYVALLAHVGCTAGRSVLRELGRGRRDPLPERRAGRSARLRSRREDMRYLVRRLADDRPLPERARLVAQDARRRPEAVRAGGGEPLRGRRGCSPTRLHLPDEVARALGQVTARWDGKGVPGEVAGEEISRPLRIVRVAHDFVAIAHGARSRGGDRGAQAAPRAGLRPGDRRRRPRRARGAPARGGRSRRLGARHRRRAAAGRDDLDAPGWRRSPGPSASSPISRSTSCAGTRPGWPSWPRRAAEALGLLARGGFGGSRRRLLPRPRQGVGAERDLGEARPVERGRVGAGSPSSLLHRARARALRRARAARRCSPARITSDWTAPATTAEPRPRS